MNQITDPVEKVVAQALDSHSVEYTTEQHPDNLGLDFYLPDSRVHIEVKQFHTPRSQKQIERSDNVILIVGMGAAKQFARMIFAKE